MHRRLGNKHSEEGKQTETLFLNLSSMNLKIARLYSARTESDVDLNV
jgi:hypothetical protein